MKISLKSTKSLTIKDSFLISLFRSIFKAINSLTYGASFFEIIKYEF